MRGLKKKPSTSELIDWIRLLLTDKIDGDKLYELDTEADLPPFIGALIKNEQDLDLITKLRNQFSRK